MIEWIVIWLLALASVRAVKNVVVDAWVQIIDPEREAPSLVNRRARAELARQQAAARVELVRQQAAAGVAPAPGQAAADRLARFIADPPPWPSWVVSALSYLALLLSDTFANLRRSHIRRQEDRERGEQQHGAHADGPYCWHCDVGPVEEPGDLCTVCAPVVLTPCTDCGVHTLTEDQDDGRCSTCRTPPPPPPWARPEPEGDDRPGPARLYVNALPAGRGGASEISASTPDADDTTPKGNQ